MQFSIRHWIPGRIRLHVPALATSPRATGKVVTWLAGQDGISSARVNGACATLVITYDEMRRALIETMLAYLVYLSPRDLVAMVDEAQSAATPAHPPAVAPASVHGSPLAP